MLTLQPSDWVVSTNQSRACLSELESESRDIPISLGPLNMSDEAQKKHPEIQRTVDSCHFRQRLRTTDRN